MSRRTIVTCRYWMSGDRESFSWGGNSRTLRSKIHTYIRIIQPPFLIIFLLFVLDSTAYYVIVFIFILFFCCIYSTHALLCNLASPCWLFSTLHFLFFVSLYLSISSSLVSQKTSPIDPNSIDILRLSILHYTIWSTFLSSLHLLFLSLALSFSLFYSCLSFLTLSFSLFFSPQLLGDVGADESKVMQVFLRPLPHPLPLSFPLPLPSADSDRTVIVD